MELIASIPLVGGLLAVLIPFIVVLGIVVAIHEYGHYIVGKWCGIHSEVFSVGYGRPIWSRVDKHGTKWQISWLPLGGYVKFLGDANASSLGDSDALDGMSQADRDRSFPAASVGRRAATVAAGPVFNFILSAFVFAGIVLYTGYPTQPLTVANIYTEELRQSPLEIGDQIRAANGDQVTSPGQLVSLLNSMDAPGPVQLDIIRDGQDLSIETPYLFPPYVQDVTFASAARKAGIEPGDLILELDGKPLAGFGDLKKIVVASNNVEIQALILRDGKEITLPVTPEIVETPDGEGGFQKVVRIGIAGGLGFQELRYTPSLTTAASDGVEQVYRTVSLSLNAIKSMITGALGLDNLSGPVGIARLAGDQASKGWVDYIYLLAAISTAIGMLNLFPIPILDGGHLVIFAYEAIVGRQPHEKFLNFAMSVGFVLLMALMVFATYNDFMKI